MAGTALRLEKLGFLFFLFHDPSLFHPSNHVALQEALEAKRSGPCSPGQHPQSHLARWWYFSRPYSTRLELPCAQALPTVRASLLRPDACTPGCSSAHLTIFPRITSRLGLQTALSAKYHQGELFIVDHYKPAVRLRYSCNDSQSPSPL